MITEAALIIRQGGLVAFPTETVYGLGANALDAAAVARIFEAKQRPSFDPLIVHLATADDIARVARTVTPLGLQLAEAFWPGPLTLVVAKADSVPPIVSSGLSTVAVRVPSHPIAHELIAAAGVPIAAPSANKFGQLSPTRAEHVRESLGNEVDLVLDGGLTDWGVESTIVDVTGDVPVVLRHGAVTVEQLRNVVSDIAESTDATATPSAPGQLESHYAPRIPLHLDTATDPASTAYLAFSKAPAETFAVVEVLSPTGDLREAAANLFDALHRLEHSDASAIYAELVPDNGLGRAINDRLRRASA